MKITVCAPAKINLALDILGKRKDGYHVVKMIMQTVDLYDFVTITPNDHGKIILSCDVSSVPLDEKNTAYKAALEFFKCTGINNPGIDINIQKNIPISAGLAGGSTDAAAVIIGINSIFDMDLSKKNLLNIGAKVGSDVPFCIVGGTMVAEGVGTVLTPLPDIPKCSIVLAKPPVSVSTKEAYKLSDNERFFESQSFDLATEAICEQDLKKLGLNLYNRFENILNIKDIKKIKDIIREYSPKGVCMSGSGPTVLGLFNDRPSAYICFNELKNQYKEVFLCEPVSFGCKIY